MKVLKSKHFFISPSSSPQRPREVSQHSKYSEMDSKSLLEKVIRNFVLRTFQRFYLIKECEILDVNCNKCKKKKGKIVIFQKLSRLSLIVRANVVLNRTIVVDSD